MTTDLLNLIINPLFIKQTCFLCFKQHADLQNIYSDLVIIENNLEFNVSVSKIMSYLFPFQETFLQQVCDKCSNVLTNIYILIQRHNYQKKNLLKIAQKLDKEISNVKSLKRCSLRLSFDEDLNNSIDVTLDSKDNEISVKELQECPKCIMKFESKNELQKHNKIGHRNTNEAIICHICGKTCKTPSALKGHLNCHIEKQCPYCLKLLKMHSHFKVHVQNHESAVKRNRKQTSYKCHNCTFISFNKGSLEAHINKAHLGLRPHVCPICHKGFFKKSNLTEHVSIHDKVKTETCEVCGDNFVNKKTLTEHLRLHTKKTPYECVICLKKFVTSGRRSDHVKRKHMEKTECCMVCNKMFSLRKELNRHIKKAHWQCDMPEFVENVDDCANIEVLMPVT